MKKKKDLVDRKRVLKILNKYIDSDRYKNMPTAMVCFYEDMIKDKGLKYTILALCNGSAFETLYEIKNKIENLKHETTSN